MFKLSKKIIIYFWLYSFLLINLTSCAVYARIDPSSAYSSSLTINSLPSNATVTGYNKKGQLLQYIQGSTPTTLKGYYPDLDNIRFELAGYPTQTVKYRRTEYSEIFWLSFTFESAIVVSGLLAAIPKRNDTGTWLGVSLSGVGFMLIDFLTGSYKSYPSNITMDFAKVSRSNTPLPSQSNRQGIEYALPDALQQLIVRVVKNSTIAVMPISATNTTLRDFVTGETEYLLVNQGFNIVDRASLDRIRTEQKMQTSGEIDDRTAVSIGKFSGANYIVLGRIVTTDVSQLRLQMLDVQTTDVVGSAMLTVGDSAIIQNPKGIEDAILLAISEATTKLPRTSRLAIVDVTANPNNDFIRGESEFALVNQGFKVIDRAQLDSVRRELNIQYSGEVDDNTAVSIGKVAGADYLVSIRTDGQGGLSRLRWRILDTQTAKIAGVASIHYEGISSIPGVSSIKEALERAIEQATPRVAKDSRIAIIQISANNNTDREYVFNESEFMLVNQGYRVVDRSQLDRVRAEQNYQLSGEVDDRTAVEIDKFAGARYIMTGSINGRDNLRRLRLRILDTQTAEVVGVSSVRF